MAKTKSKWRVVEKAGPYTLGGIIHENGNEYRITELLSNGKQVKYKKKFVGGMNPPKDERKFPNTDQLRGVWDNYGKK